MNHQPPKFADKFLEWFCSEDLLEDLQGDLYESFNETAKSKGILQAQIQYMWLVLRSFRISTIRKNNFLTTGIIGMTTNNFKIAFRVLVRNKVTTSLNLLGLVIGMTCFLLLGFYGYQEYSFDKFHSKSDRIYRVWLKEVYAEDKIFFNSVTPFVFKPVLQDNFPEFEEVVTLAKQNFSVGSGQDKKEEEIAVITPSFFSVFDFKLMQGNTVNPLESKSNIIISESYALKYFGDLDPIGKSMTISLNGRETDFIVSATFKDMRHTSSFNFNMAISDELGSMLYGEDYLDRWFSIFPETYVLVNQKSTISTVESQIPGVVKKYLGDRVNEGEYNIGFQPLEDIHLNPEIPLGLAPVSNPVYINLLISIGILVLLAALLNYSTLALGQSLNRTKEVGIRKVMGAFRGSIFYQYLTESTILAFFATSIGIGLVYLILPIFNNLAGTNIVYVFNPIHILIYLIIIFLLGISSGFYPAIVLSGMKIISVLKGKKASVKAHFISRLMVVFQFAITVFLITSTLIMRDQLNYLQNKDTGINYKATVAVNLYPNPEAERLSERINTGMENGLLLLDKLKQYPELSDLGLGSHVVGSGGWQQLGYNADDGSFKRFRLLSVDPGYFQTFDIKLKEGRFFQKDNSADQNGGVILNRSAVEYFGMEDPIGKKMPNERMGDHLIVGVVEDFNYQSLHSNIEPLVIVQKPNFIYSGINDLMIDASPVPKLVFRYQGNKLENVKEILDKEWNNTFPQRELDFSFIEDNMRYAYQNEIKLSKLISLATVLSIVVASLGLLGIALLVVGNRIREISIRKVIGASELSIFGLLSKGFFIQILIGIIISVPVTFYIMNSWLADFAYRIEIGAGIFIFSGIISLSVAFIVISFHTLKAAFINPIETIKTD